VEEAERRDVAWWDRVWSADMGDVDGGLWMVCERWINLGVVGKRGRLWLGT
jgi:hypothetical protein